MMNNDKFQLCTILECVAPGIKKINFRLYDTEKYSILFEREFTTTDDAILFERVFSYSESDNITDPYLHFFNLIKNEIASITGDHFVKGYMQEMFNLNYGNKSTRDDKEYDIFHDIFHDIYHSGELEYERLLQISRYEGKYYLYSRCTDIDHDNFYESTECASFEVTMDEIKSIINSLSEFVKNEDSENV